MPDLHLPVIHLVLHRYPDFVLCCIVSFWKAARVLIRVCRGRAQGAGLGSITRQEHIDEVELSISSVDQATYLASFLSIVDSPSRQNLHGE